MGPKASERLFGQDVHLYLILYRRDYSTFTYYGSNYPKENAADRPLRFLSLG